MFTIPFTHESIREQFCGKAIVMYRNELTSPKYRRIGGITLTEDGAVTGDGIDGWEAGGGILFLLNQGQVKYRIDSLEVTNGVAHAMGEALHEAHSLYSKIVLSIKQPPQFSICISSHVDYYETTIPRLLKSLRRVGIAGETLIVVTDPAKRPEPLPELPAFEGMDVTVKQVGINRHGFTALMESHCQTPYWLLLHDTCEVVKAFPEGLADADVGLSPDFILLADTMDLGFYSSLFIDAMKDTMRNERPDKVRRRLKDSANIWVEGPDIQRLPAKDVYGGGTKREVHLLDIGIKKYVQSKLDGAKP